MAWLRESIRVGAESRAASGFALGALAGLRFSLSDAVSLEAAVGADALRFGDSTAGG